MSTTLLVSCGGGHDSCHLGKEFDTQEKLLESCHAAVMNRTSTIVYVDERIVAINKPSGISLATRRAEPQRAVARLLGALSLDERSAFGLDAADLFLVHRLDVTTSGVVVLARDAEVHRELADAFAHRRVDKTYLALVWGRPKPQRGVWEWPLGPDRRDRRRMRVDVTGRAATTLYRVVERAPHVALVELVPLTGRTHQLRVHLAHAGHSIVGDDLYAGPRHLGVRDANARRILDAPRMLLHAWRLRLPATRTSRELILTASLPADFTACLEGLGLAAPP